MPLSSVASDLTMEEANIIESAFTAAFAAVEHYVVLQEFLQTIRDQTYVVYPYHPDPGKRICI